MPIDIKKYIDITTGDAVMSVFDIPPNLGPTFAQTVAAWFDDADGEINWFDDWRTAGHLFVDNLGIEPVQSLESIVGLQLDRSKGLKRSDPLNTVSFANGVPIGGPATSQYPTGATVTAGKWYELSAVVSDFSGTGGVGFGSIGLFGSSTQRDSSGLVRCIRLATGSGALSVFTQGTNTANFSEISVREVPGNHTVQALSPKRRRLSARKNWLQDTGSFAAASWVKTNGGTGSIPIVTDNAGIAPDGTNTASRIQMALNGGTTAADISRIRQTAATIVGVPAAQKMWLKTNDGTTKTISFRDDNALTVNQNIVITPEWQEFSFPGVAAQTASINAGALWLRGTVGTSDSADLLAWHPSLEFVQVGAFAGRYQRVTTPTDYDAVGFPVGLRSDGIDDMDSTAQNIDFSAVQKITTLWSGLKASDATLATALEHSGAYNTTPGAFALFAPGSPTLPIFTTSANIEGSNLGIVATPYPAPYSAVISSALDYSKTNRIDAVRMWIGANQIIGTSAPLAGTQFGTNAQMFHSGRNSQYFLTGLETGRMVIGKELTTEQREYVRDMFARLNQEAS